MAQLTFDLEAFAAAMNKHSEFDTSKHGKISWSDKSGHAMKYYNHKGLDYRTWKPDTSLSRGGIALIVSSKIDQPRSGTDDHLVLLACFNRACTYVTVQAGVQRKAHKSAGGEVIVAKDGIDVMAAFKRSVDAAVEEVLGKKADDGFEFMSSVAAANLDCMRQAVKYR
jgi:hypothetical protein